MLPVAGQTLRRAVMRAQTTGRVWVEHPDSGRRRDLGRTVAPPADPVPAVLGQLIPLLQVTPSTTDAERRLPIAPELADVLSAIVTRIRCGQPHVPTVVPYDENERVYNPPTPLLFHWRPRPAGPVS